MLVAELTPYGQSVVSTHVTIDGIILLSEYLLNIDSLTNISSYTTLLDEDACGNISKSNGYVKVLDTSESVYQARTLLFYSLSGSTKNIVAGCSQSEAIVNKTSSVLNIQVPVDLSCFTNGFIFSSIQSGYHTASDNIDGVVHIDDPSLDSDDTYSVYSKPQVDTLLSNKQSSLEAGDGISLSDNIVRTTGIPFGICDSTSTATKFTVTVPGIYKLEDGVTCMVKNGVVTSASGFTLNVNGLGAKPCYTNLAAATRDTTIFNVAYTMLFVYDSTRVSGGCWICYRGYDSNTNTVGYQLRTNSTVMTVTDTARYYKLYFTSADGNHWVPASINSTNNATTARAVNQRPIDPFGRIVYTSANTSYAAGANLAATTIWDQYAIALGYSFNVNGGDLTLTTKTPVYVKCAPQSNGSAIMDATTPIVQTLPSSADGKIYILLGVAYDAIHIELVINHPVYYHDGSGIKLWTGSVIPSKTTDLVNDAGFITEDDIPTNVSAFTNDAGYLTSHQSLSSVVASAQYNSTSKKIEFYNPSGTKLNTDIDASAFIKDGMVDTVEVSGGNLVITFNTDAGKEDIEIPISDIFDANNYYTKTQVDGLIPTVNNAKLTIKKNASDTGTEFTANASTNVTCNLGLATVATSGSYADLSNKPTIPTVNDTAITIKKNASDTGDSFTTNTATAKTINLGLSTVATSGSYNDLSNKPTIPTVNNSTITIKKNSDDTGDSFTTNASSGKTINLGLATVATSGSYNDLSNKPTIPTVNNATLTIQKNGTTVKTFTANASSNVTANITVPLESISVDGTTQTITNKNVDLHIPDDVYSSDFICSMTRTNVSGSGNLTLSGTVGPFPVSGTPMPAGTYRVRIRMRSTTSSYSLTVNFGGSYTLTSSNGVIDDIRSVTLSSASTFSASVTQVNANTYIKVSIYEPDVIVTDIGDAAVTNDYNDLENIPNGTLIIQKNGSNVASFSASATSNATANITVPTTTSQLTNNSGFITSADLPTNVSQLNNDVGYITSYTETDPTVPSWAKESTKPSYNLDEVSDGTTRKLSDYVRLATTNRENQTIYSSITIHPKHNSYNNYREYTFDGTDFSARTSMELKSWEYDGNNVERSILVSIRPEPYAGVLDNSTYTPAEYIRISTSDGQISNNLFWITEEFDANGSKYNIYGAAVANYSSVPNTSLVDGRLTTVDYVNAKSKLSNWYAVCSTGASTKAKKITIPGFTLETGAKVTVKFTATNSASAPTLTVNNGDTDSEAKPICYRGTSAVTTGNYYRWQANDILDLVYDGTNWIIVGWQTYSYYSTISSYATYVGSGSSTYVAYSNNGSAGSRALLPRVDVTTTDWVDLGSSNKRWKTLYLTDSINDGTNSFALPDKSGTLALESKTYTVSRSPLESNLIQSGKDYRQSRPSGSDFSYNPKWSGEDVSIGISQYIDLSENSRISVYVPDTTYVGSIAFLSALGASTYSAYPLYFRGDSSAHNATVPGGSILRLTFRDDAFYTDFYDLADFGVEHEPIVRVGKLTHQSNDIYDYNGSLVGIRNDNGKLDKILTVTKSGTTVTESITTLHSSSPIYVSFMGECFSAHPRVPFGFITNLEYIYTAGSSPDSDNIPFVYIGYDGYIVHNPSDIQSHIVVNPSSGARYFHINNAPVYFSYRPLYGNKYIAIGGPNSGYSDKNGVTLIGYLPSNPNEAGLLRLITCFTPNSYAANAANAYEAGFSTRAYMLVQGNSSSGSAGLVCSTELSSYVDIKPGTNKNNALSLGSTTYRWKDIYVNGSSSSYYLEIGNDTSGSTHSTNQPVIRPTTNGVGYLGTSDYHLNTAYINNLYVTSSGTSIASYIESQISSKISGTGVGSICLLNVSITNSSSSAASVSRGSLLNSNSNLSVSATLSIASPHLVTASSATPSSYSNTVGCYYSGSASGTSGAYKLLSSLHVPANTTKRYIVLAIRVS